MLRSLNYCTACRFRRLSYHLLYKFVPFCVSKVLYLRTVARLCSEVHIPCTLVSRPSQEGRNAGGDENSEKQCSTDTDGNCFRIEESSPVRRNVDTEGIPISLLGDGLKRSKLRYTVKKRRQEGSFSKSLPIAVHSQLKDTQSFFSHFPQITHCASLVAGETEHKEKKIQFPFAESKSSVINTIQHSSSKYKEVAQSSQPKSLVNSCQEIQDLQIAREELWRLNRGTPDATVPVSNVPCGGCGALLHCKDPSLPGYLPSEKLKFCSKRRLKSELCQRCVYMHHFNVALNVSVHPEDYPKIISEIRIRHQKALVILLVDLTDFPCSLWPGIIDVIGPKMPLFVVGNKVDLLPCDQRGYLSHIISSLKENLKSFGVDKDGNIRHVSLISAKTGYGIEELITKLHNSWCNGSDIFLVGCTNVGKSTLFNTLLESDLCKVQAVDIVQRATTSPWPGTTLNTLKFPILKMSRWRLYLRADRLIKERKKKTEEQKVRKLIFKETKDLQYATLTGQIGMTFKEDDVEEKLIVKRKPFDPNSKEFAYGHFCYDTPGAVYHDQILNLLTVEELMLTLPKTIIIPRTYRVSKFQTMLVAGLARIDLVDAPQSILVTVFSSHLLPVHMVYTEQAETFYNHYLGTELLAVPSGTPERLQDFPSLTAKEIEIVGNGWKKSCADVTLSSAGWISVTLGNGDLCKLLVYTPKGRGCHVRKTPLLPYAVNLKGKRISGTPAYENSRATINIKPQKPF